MTDRFLYAVLMVCLTLGGVAAIGADLARDQARLHEATLRVVRLEPVTITGKRLAPNAAVALIEQRERAEPVAQRAQ